MTKGNSFQGNKSGPKIENQCVIYHIKSLKKKKSCDHIASEA